MPDAVGLAREVAVVAGIAARASVASSTVAKISSAWVSSRWRAILASCDQHLIALDCLRNRFLVASRPAQDLLLCAKDLFVAAITVWHGTAADTSSIVRLPRIPA